MRSILIGESTFQFLLFIMDEKISATTAIEILMSSDRSIKTINWGTFNFNFILPFELEAGAKSLSLQIGL